MQGLRCNSSLLFLRTKHSSGYIDTPWQIHTSYPCYDWNFYCYVDATKTSIFLQKIVKFKENSKFLPWIITLVNFLFYQDNFVLSFTMSVSNSIITQMARIEFTMPKRSVLFPSLTQV